MYALTQQLQSLPQPYCSLQNVGVGENTDSVRRAARVCVCEDGQAPIVVEPCWQTLQTHFSRPAGKLTTWDILRWGHLDCTHCTPTAPCLA